MDFINAFAVSLQAIGQGSGFVGFTSGNLIMILVGLLLLYLAFARDFEPLLLSPIAFGCILANVPFNGFEEPGVMSAIGMGIKYEIFPPLIFLGVGAMTDFGPLIARPSSLLMGAAAQFGVFVALLGAMMLGFNAQEAGSIGIIGGADGPTSIYLASKMAPHLLGAIAVAAYTYMALVPLIQPPVMKLLTSKREREVVMEQAREVTKFERIAFPIVSTIFISLLLPSITALLGMLMLGNLFRECGVVERLSDVAQNALCNICTIFLGLSVGATARGELFLRPQTLAIVGMGLAAFSFSTFGGVVFGKILYAVTGGKINPLIGSAGVSAVPMAARVSQTVGSKTDRTNFLLMHAMGPNVAGVIGSAVAAGFFLTFFAH